VFLEDLPNVVISPLRAAGDITTKMDATFVTIGDVEFRVGVTHRIFPNGGSWSFFRCPRCGRRARRLWLPDEIPACRYCCNRLGMRCRVEHLTPCQRAAYRAPRLRAALSRETPLKHTARAGQTMDRRQQLERSLLISEHRLRRQRAEGPFR
jgi:hypothetical protein